MHARKAEALAAIDRKADLFTAVGDDVWSYAELSLLEFQSAGRFVGALNAEGFSVTAPYRGVETAFLAEFGAGRPIIGILAEYDALASLSQIAGAVGRAAREGTDCGHGCGHNLLGAGAFAAAVAVKKYLELSGKPGTVRLYGCPGEEGCASKAYFAKLGVWRELDAALTWHPGDVNEVATGSSMACIQTEYRFTGVASHAAGCPELGRSALDAVELMNVGVQYLREHMPKTASVHYAVTYAGGPSPNVVQSGARVLYMVREQDMHAALALRKRVDAIALGAAMMTETGVAPRLVDCNANLAPNQALEELLYRNFEEIGVPSYSEEEWAFAAALKATYADIPYKPSGTGADENPEIAAFVSERTDGGKRALNDFLMPPFHSVKMQPGSTDVSDVSWLTPTAQIRCVAAPNNCPGHSWQNVSAGATSLSHKGLLCAGKVLAAAVIDLIDDPSLLAPARAEFERSTLSGYVNPMPDEGFTLKAV